MVVKCSLKQCHSHSCYISFTLFQVNLILKYIDFTKVKIPSLYIYKIIFILIQSTQLTHYICHTTVCVKLQPLWGNVCD